MVFKCVSILHTLRKRDERNGEKPQQGLLYPFQVFDKFRVLGPIFKNYNYQQA